MKKFVSFVLIVVFLISFANITFAATQSFQFDLANSGSVYYVYTGNSNTKIHLEDEATIKCDYTNAPGFGYRLGLCNGNTYAKATEKKWYGTNGKCRNHSYDNGMAIVNESYRVSGRIDNDYPGPYTIQGRYNADKVSMP